MTAVEAVGARWRAPVSTGTTQAGRPCLMARGGAMISAMIEALICRRPRQRDDALAVRLAVFVDEQGIAREDEIDEHDATDAIHCVAYDEGRPVGAGRLVIDGERGKIGRMAVLPEYRRRGVGAAVLRALEEEGQARGLRQFKLSAQTHARGFYERCGYAAYGEVYDDVGIPHIDMTKRVD